MVVQCLTSDVGCTVGASQSWGHPMSAALCLWDVLAALQLGWTVAPGRRPQVHLPPLIKLHLLSLWLIHCHPCSKLYSNLRAPCAGYEFGLQVLGQGSI